MRNSKIVAVILGAGLGLAVAPSAAWAQIQGPPGVNQANRPAFSPYLNLTRTDINPTISYYGIIRPELAFSKALQQVQTQQSNLAYQQDQAATGANAPPPTGQPAGFMTQGRYFMTQGRGQGGGGAAVGAGTTVGAGGGAAK